MSEALSQGRNQPNYLDTLGSFGALLREVQLAESEVVRTSPKEPFDYGRPDKAFRACDAAFDQAHLMRLIGRAFLEKVFPQFVISPEQAIEIDVLVEPDNLVIFPLERLLTPDQIAELEAKGCRIERYPDGKPHMLIVSRAVFDSIFSGRALPTAESGPIGAISGETAEVIGGQL